MSRERRNSGKRDDQRGRRKGSQGHNSGRSKEKREGKDNQTKCFRCGSTDHLAANCPIYKERSPAICRDCKLEHPTEECRNRRQSNHTEVREEAAQKQQRISEAQRLFNEHFNVSRAVSHERNSSNQFNAVNIHDCLNDVCVSSNNTNLDSNPYSCRFSNSKLTQLNLSTSQVHQSNSDSRASPQKAWNLYSEYDGQEMSQKKSALQSHSTMKTKPDKYRFQASDPPAL